MIYKRDQGPVSLLDNIRFHCNHYGNSGWFQSKSEVGRQTEEHCSAESLPRPPRLKKALPVELSSWLLHGGRRVNRGHSSKEGEMELAMVKPPTRPQPALTLPRKSLRPPTVEMLPINPITSPGRSLWASGLFPICSWASTTWGQPWPLPHTQSPLPRQFSLGVALERPAGHPLPLPTYCGLMLQREPSGSGLVSTLPGPNPAQALLGCKPQGAIPHPLPWLAGGWGSALGPSPLLA